jgi:Flavin reductase like domain
MVMLTASNTAHKLTAVPGRHVNAPLIKECLANIECKAVDFIEKHNIVVLEAVAAYEDPERKERPIVHAVGDDTFIVDGRRLDRREMMASKIRAGPPCGAKRRAKSCRFQPFTSAPRLPRTLSASRYFRPQPPACLPSFRAARSRMILLAPRILPEFRCCQLRMENADNDLVACQLLARRQSASAKMGAVIFPIAARWLA